MTQQGTLPFVERHRKQGARERGDSTRQQRGHKKYIRLMRETVRLMSCREIQKEKERVWGKKSMCGIVCVWLQSPPA
jgi:hypothetical protein